MTARPPSSALPTRPLRRWLGRLTGAVWTLTAVVAVLLVVGYVALDVTVKRVLSRLSGQAFPGGVSYRVLRVTPWELTMGDVAVPGDRSAALTLLTARFDPLRIVRGEVDAVVISGLRVSAEVGTDGTFRLIGLPGGEGRVGSEWLLALPHEIRVADGVLTLRHQGELLTYPISLHLKAQQGRASATVEAGPGGSALRGQVDLAPAAGGGMLITSTGNATLPLSSLLPLVPEAWREGLSAAGNLQLKWAQAGTDSVQLELRSDDAVAGMLPWGQVALSSAEARLSWSDGVWMLTATVQGAVSVPQWLPGTHTVRVTLGGTPELLTGDTVVSGPMGSVLAREVHLRRAADGNWAVSGQLAAAWQLPAELLTVLRSAGVEVREPGRVCGNARFTYAVGGWTADLTDLATDAGEVIYRGREGAGDFFAASAVRIGLDEATLVWPSGSTPSLAGKGLRLWGRASVNTRAVSVVQGGDFALSAPGFSLLIDPKGQVLASVPDLAVSLDPTELSLAAAGSAPLTQLTGVSGVLQVGMDHRPDQTSLRLTRPGRVAWTSLRTDSGLGIVCGESAVVVSPDAEWPLFLRSDAGLAVAGELCWAEPSVVGGGAHWTAETIDLSGRMRSLTQGIWSFDARTRIGGLTARHAASGLAVEGLSLDVPLRGVLGDDSASRPEEGSFSAQAVVYAGRRLAGLTGTVYVSREGLWAGLDWPLLTEGTVKASAAVNWTGGPTTCELELWIPPFDFTRSHEIRTLLPEALADADIRGTFSGRVQYFLGRDSVVRWGEVEVKDGSLRSRELDAELTGVSGRVWTRSFSPLETPPGQTLTVERGRLGKLEVKNGQVNFRLDPGDIVFVESAAFDYAGGTLSARGFRVQPGRGAADLVVYADNIDIGTLASSLSEGRISGTGRLFARLPASIVWPERVHLGSGYIYAEASGQPGRAGTLRFTGYADEIGNLVARSMGPPTGDRTRDAAATEVRSRVTAALVDFGFNSLTLDITRPENAPLILTIRTNGRGPPLPGNRRTPPSPGQELDLTFNVTGLEDVVNRYLGLRGSGIGF